MVPSAILHWVKEDYDPNSDTPKLDFLGSQVSFWIHVTFSIFAHL